MEKGNFRDDLYYRLSVIPMNLPPLRDRKNDIPLLVEYFLEKAAIEGQNTDGISKDALSIMVDYSWPGNVRELQSAIQYALIKSKGQVIKPDHLPMEFKVHATKQSVRGPSRKLDSASVHEALTRSGGNKAKAARFLGVGRATLYRFLTDFPKSDL
jgi:transcriptional regulator with PAS, ATPase and Fis domain